ncbi:glycine oxidase ThiO [Arthrobacter sp. JZ12]|uniref:glycine oxidase ThiO n=1 Tax=Arthrobacter sp. JZ12 TaxID=2654190 RepID=UPI002B494AD6|nr:glycine oxidase ThiO [Arthrobacter sp. JZ12]WRH25463.1 glycine oxidase ThiO [Arthrobacter sp. JZ12]
METEVDVAVVGGGIVGLGIAWEALRRGLTAVVIDPAPATGATHAAAGMIAPASELHYREEHLLQLTLDSAARYPEFLASLEWTGIDPEYRGTGTVVLAVDAADRQSLADLREVQKLHGLDVEQLPVREVRRSEPLIGPAPTGAFRAAGDHQVDPRKLAESLLVAVRARGQVIGMRATALQRSGTTVTGVMLDDGSAVRARSTVVANGLDAATLEGLPVPLPLRPVYGDILRLRVPTTLRPLLNATVRGLVRGHAVYVVPREDGTVVIGATMREDGSGAVSAGGVYQLLRDAQQLIPAVAELELEEVLCRARPGTPDNAPLMGCVPGNDGLIVATGFFRHGVLLTPAAAAACIDLAEGKPLPAGHERYRPDRFQKGSV